MDVEKALEQQVGQPAPKPTTKPVGKVRDWLTEVFNGDANGMLNKMFEYIKGLHAEQFPDHEDHQEAP